MLFLHQNFVGNGLSNLFGSVTLIVIYAIYLSKLCLPGFL